MCACLTAGARSLRALLGAVGPMPSRFPCSKIENCRRRTAPPGNSARLAAGQGIPDQRVAALLGQPPRGDRDGEAAEPEDGADHGGDRRRLHQPGPCPDMEEDRRPRSPATRDNIAAFEPVRNMRHEEERAEGHPEPEALRVAGGDHDEDGDHERSCRPCWGGRGTAVPELPYRQAGGSAVLATVPCPGSRRPPTAGTTAGPEDRPEPAAPTTPTAGARAQPAVGPCRGWLRPRTRPGGRSPARSRRAPSERIEAEQRRERGPVSISAPSSGCRRAAAAGHRLSQRVQYARRQTASSMTPSIGAGARPPPSG